MTEPTCSTPCDNDCAYWCHEEHEPMIFRDHSPSSCPAVLYHHRERA